MKCTVCGGELKPRMTDLPFKITDTTIVIVKGVPVMQCETCSEYLIEDDVLRRVDEILATANGGIELEIVRYAA